MRRHVVHLRIDEDHSCESPGAGHTDYGHLVEYDGQADPVEECVDFGPTILGWWGLALTRVIIGSDAESFMFMDGPYHIRVRYELEEGIIRLEPPGTAWNWTTTIRDLVDVLTDSTTTVVVELKRLDVAPKQITGLERSVQLMHAARNAMSGDER